MYIHMYICYIYVFFYHRVKSRKLTQNWLITEDKHLEQSLVLTLLHSCSSNFTICTNISFNVQTMK